MKGASGLRVGDGVEETVEDGVEVVGGLKVGEVADALEDFKAGVGDGLLHLFRGVYAGIRVFGAYDDEGGNGDVAEGRGVVLALGASAEGSGCSGGWGAGDHFSW